ncbi:flagellar basal body rod protein FlgC [Ponticaulis sp.]|uniref:flagellar basal body rod protein FlgC n=1 Tax=Ponticaulis sp. TaxID=2020902 RepID=UPI000B6CE391|nr:flagellar basal body rod protein FlgC [Ponticaulis sp.]MAJ07474.1 flagellar basal body rod protein FlgC [Ponticaulis sp.]RPG17706.1 MAG: flagellar basal body rod protein FlgC [Hyphomonadaceae bacterium TMED125]HBH91045.1 flagellar basal body rod protein FlgC [Hyphomonadaceae bacterium]HBJ93900.1 flagellar basal body rod protein FlgC [Hyphomonadaceae bacterium]|tara:strand:- start:20556 stop:20984 length:429 start_codon:yes stop_codon:yes gene_type:complete
MQAFEISLSALDVEWQRYAVIAENLANVNSPVDAAGNRVGARRLLSGPAVDFQTLMTTDLNNREPVGVRVFAIEEMQDPVRSVYEPDHPSANAEGFVQYANVDHGQEMSLLVKTMRVYEANLTAMSISKQMYMKALEMGRTV